MQVDYAAYTSGNGYIQEAWESVASSVREGSGLQKNALRETEGKFERVAVEVAA